MTASLDDRVAVWVATHRYAPLDGVFLWLGRIEKLGAVWIVLAVAASLVARRDLRAGVALVALTALACFAADSAALGLKDLVHRARPFEAHPRIHPLSVVHSSSFPSGHAATALAGATLLSYLAPRALPLFVALAGAVGYSRVYVGVHYPGDVLAGAGVGLLVGAASCVAIAVARRRGRRERLPGAERGQRSAAI